MKIDYKKILILALLLFAGFISNVSINKTNINYGIKVSDFPRILGDFVGKNIKINGNDRAYSIFSPNEFLLREYNLKNKTQNITMALVVSNNKKKIHDPQICYPLQGFNFIVKKHQNISSNLNVNLINAQKNGKKYLFLYWYTDFSNTYYSRTEFWKSIIIGRILNKNNKTLGLVVLFSPIENAANLIKLAKYVNQSLMLNINGTF